MTDMLTIGKFLEDPEIGTAEKWVIKWQYRLLGDFETALAHAIALADERNLQRLNDGFPTQVSGFLAWSQGDLAQRLRKAGLDI
jgi:hypothetical protein